MVFYIVRDWFCEEDQNRFLESDWRNTTFLNLPHVTECAQHIDLSWLPTWFLILALPVIGYDLNKSNNEKTTSFSPITYRIIICGILFLDLTVSFFYNGFEFFVDGDKSVLPYLVGDFWQYVGLALAIVILIAQKNRGIVTSGSLFIYWLLMVVAGFPELRFLWATSGEAESKTGVFRFVLYIIFYILICLQLFLSCFADTPASKFTGTTECPELHSSFLSQITFNWFHGLAVLGNRKPLEREDLWDLNERDTGAKLNPEFERYYRKEVNEFRARTANMKEEEIQSKDYPSVLWPLFKTYKWSLIAGSSYKFIFDLLQFAAPELLRQLIAFIQDKGLPTWIGVMIASMIFIVALVQSMILHQYFHLMFRTGMNIRSVLISTVYKKALNLSNNARKNRTVGEIVNLMSVDVQRFQDMTTYFLLFLSAPLQICLSLYFLFRLLGVAVVAGLLILLATLPFNYWISMKMKDCQISQMKYKDERLKMMSEILNGIKVLKLYAWEKSMEKLISNIREKEIYVLKVSAFLSAATTLSWACAPFLVAVFTFGVYVIMDPENNILTPQVTFVALALFNILRFPLAIISMIFTQAVQCHVSNKRLKEFFASEEMDTKAIENKSNNDVSISISEGCFSWDKTDELHLNNINLEIKKGSLVAVVGRIGSGKSSLVQAILGEMNKRSGKVNVSGSVAYVPQQAWIQNLTLRDNILFDRTFIGSWYDRVISSCALMPDFETLPAGDNTEIGEKGINLSGGQKQRVSLARAVYATSDIVLLDDPLSAVDTHVGKHIFENVIANGTGLLSESTRILVTHGLHYLKYCDKIIVLKEGGISEIGTYSELMARQGAFSELIEEFLVEEATKRGRSVSFGEDADDVQEILMEISKIDPERRQKLESQLSQEIGKLESQLSRESARISEPRKSPESVSPASPVSNGHSAPPNAEESLVANLSTKNEDKVALIENGEKKPPAPKAKLIEKEGVETGKVAWGVYMTYLNSIGFGVSVLFICVYICSSILGVWSNLWLAAWSDEAANIQARSNGTGFFGSQTAKNLGMYTLLGLGQAVTVCSASVIMALGMVKASKYLHGSMLTNILHSPMSFFDTTPLGRILNRFGKDTEAVDCVLPEVIGDFIACYGEVLLTMALMVYTVPTVALPVFIVIVMKTRLLDIDAVDSTVPHSVRSMITTLFSVVATLVVIVWATPIVLIPFLFVTIFYCWVVDVDALDSRIPSTILTFVGSVIQAIMIVFVPVYITPTALFVMAPVFIVYYFVLDVEGLDSHIPRSLLSFVRTLIASAEIVTVIVISVPMSSIAMSGLFVMYYFVLRFYVSTSRQLKRLESASKSPIYSHFQESIQGVSSIRAYKCMDKFVKESQRRVDENLATYYPTICANRWLAVRLELVGNLIVLSAALFAALYRDSPGLTAGLVGLSVSYALNITQTLNWAVRMTSELETNIVAVERIKEYSETPTEGFQNSRRSQPDWPAKGRISINNYSLRYRPGLDLVLKDITAHIESCEKIGIVGRTGAGKSSLTLALFRIVEANSGTILVDDENIADIVLEDVRSRLTIVPQEPVMFSGTLRSNLDPFYEFSDDQIWSALRDAHLESFVSLLPDRLQHGISEGGKNLSVGQLQLICLARALLRKPKILVLDEAAASVDMETDALIQKTIREQFKECTVLTIAHRLNTVMDSDRILVLDQGYVAEFDTPKNLLANPKSIFHSMASEAHLI